MVGFLRPGPYLLSITTEFHKTRKKNDVCSFKLLRDDATVADVSTSVWGLAPISNVYFDQKIEMEANSVLKMVNTSTGRFSGSKMAIYRLS